MSKPIIIAVSLILALILGLILCLPKYQSWRNLLSEIKVKEIEFQTREEYYSQIREIERKLSEHKEALAKIASALPPDPSLPALFDFLYLTVARSGLVLEDITLERIDLPEEERIKEIYVNLELSGSYSSLKDFLLALERTARLIEVRTISFDSPEDPEEPFSFKIKVKTQSY